MNYQKFNDYEILDLVREGNDEALNLMFEKYKNLISKKIYIFNLNDEYEDIFQEGLEMLYKSIIKFDDSYNKTFTRYFEMNLERKFISISKSRLRRNRIFNSNIQYIYDYVLYENKESIYTPFDIEEALSVLTKTEKLVYKERELNNRSINYIANNYNIKEKSIYNALHRAKNKIKKHFS